MEMAFRSLAKSEQERKKCLQVIENKEADFPLFLRRPQRAKILCVGWQARAGWNGQIPKMKLESSAIQGTQGDGQGVLAAEAAE
jgi:hypothetical protein